MPPQNPRLPDHTVCFHINEARFRVRPPAIIAWMPADDGRTVIYLVGGIQVTVDETPLNVDAVLIAHDAALRAAAAGVTDLDDPQWQHLGPKRS